MAAWPPASLAVSHEDRAVSNENTTSGEYRVYFVFATTVESARSTARSISSSFSFSFFFYSCASTCVHLLSVAQSLCVQSFDSDSRERHTHTHTHHDEEMIDERQGARSTRQDQLDETGGDRLLMIRVERLSGALLSLELIMSEN